MLRGWGLWVALACVAVLCVSPSGSDSKDPFANMPRIMAENGNLILKSADGHNLSLSTGSGGHVIINGVDMTSLLSTVRDGGAGQQISLPVQRWATQFFQQWRNNIDSQLGALEENMTAVSTKVNQLVGSGQETLSNRRLRRFMGKIQMLTEKVNRLTQMLTVDECSSNPCRNGGSCIDAYNGFICNCPSTWEGTTCEMDVNECATLAGTGFGCQNGATCYNSPGTYRCECPSNWYGVHCTEKHDDCSTASHQELCGHGVCIDEKRVQPGLPKFRCICDAGWRTDGSGPACSTDVDECAGGHVSCSRNPPVTCHNYPGSFHCGPCPAGYSGNGVTCADVNECETNNGGCSTHPMVACSNTIGSRNCGPCPTGYVGNGVFCSFVGICAVNRGGCHPMASCIENTAITGTYRECRCPAGYVGNGEGLTGCVTASTATSCASNPCHQGTCQMSGNSFHCICNPGYFGSLCERQIDPCVSNPCENGGTCVSNQGTFTCTCLEPFSGTLCSEQQRSCNERFSGDNGTLRFPPVVGEQYGHRENCAWTISVNETKVINVTVHRFEVESSPDCQYDFLQINDGPSLMAQLLARICGTARESINFTSTHSQLHLWFRSDGSHAGTGFELSWNATDPVCGGFLNVSDYGTVKSPGYPGQYPRNRNCSWTVQVPIGKRIQFHFATLRLEQHPNCSFDFLAIYDGASPNDPLLHKYCTTETPPPLITSGHVALLDFHSDPNVEDKGFHITYASVPGIQGCGGELTTPTGTIASPNFPDTYENQLNCEWLIRIHPNSRIMLSFSDFHLESHGSCRFDNVEVYDGANDLAPLLGRFCGSTVPPDRMSNSHQLYIKFKTDSSVQRPGFKATYRTVCGGVLSQLSGVLSSPYFPLPYPAKTFCMYDIRLPLGYIANVTFTSFDLESHGQCDFDYLEVRDGGSDDSPLYGRKLCGATIPDNIVSSYNQMRIKFVTDGSFQRQGFYAQYEAVHIGCGGVLTENNGQLSSPMHPDTYPHSITCTWFLKAPPGYIVRLTFDTFHLEVHATCNYDYVIIQDYNGASMGRYCGSSSPPILTSTENMMFVKFAADSSIAREGFVASYVFLDASQTCGGDYYLESGVVRSPGYPNHYPPHMRCVWRFIGPNQRQFAFNVTGFSLESHQDCRYDYLEIRNGGQKTSPLVGKYCGEGETIPRPILSHSNIMRLEFRSDSSQSGQGFEIYYDAATTGCGGTLNAPSGTIVSPNYPDTHPSNSDCQYLIHTSEGSRISLSIVDLDIEAHRSCQYDYLQVFDGGNENARSLARLCNNQQNPGALLSMGNTMYIRFRSDFSESGRGFHLSYQSVCNNILTKRRGVIESPNFPNTYPHNHNCTWLVTAPPGNNITIAFSHIYMEGGDSCARDYIEVLEQKRDEQTQTSLAKYCGTPTNLPPLIETSSNMVVVRLVTDASVSREGFRLEYVVKGCGGDLRDKNYGVITSPNFPNGYPFRTTCTWHIWYPPGNRVELRVTDIDIERSNDCIYDHLRVYAGEDTSAPRIANMCENKDGPQIVSSNGNEIFVVFHSDVSMTGRGFKASFSKLRGGCGGRFSAAEATIMSPNYPSAYDPLSDCKWQIEVDPNHLVALDFYEFNLPQSTNCTQGHVSIYDGDNSSAPLLMRHCGATKPQGSVMATGHLMLIHLATDGTNVATGFKAHYKTGCGRRLWADDSGEITSPNYPRFPPNPIASPFNCSWIIAASQPGEKVTLVITHLQNMNSIVESSNCSLSSIRVTDGDLPDSPLIGQFCESHAPPAIISRGNTLHVMMTSVVFRATYGVASSHCGGSFSSIRGTFTSPGYPNNYPMGTECEWTITASAGNQVLLSFQSFQMEQSEEYCNLDYLEIHLNDAAGPLIGRYCGGSRPDNLTAVHRLWVKFRSDAEGTEAGFMAHYEVVPGSQLSGTEGFIESPGYPHSYLNSGVYDWTVTVPFEQSVSVRFLTMNIDQVIQDTVCRYSSVTIFDGPDDTSPELGKYCGYEIPADPAVTVGNVAFIRYVTESQGAFRLQWTALSNRSIVIDEPAPVDDSGSLRCWHEFNINSSGGDVTVDSPNYPMEYPPRLNCTYIVRGPPSDHIVINFLDIELESANNCIFDVIQVFILPNPAANDWHLNQTICGRVNATTLTSPNNMLKIVFKTDGSVQLKGFHAVANSMCGGHIDATDEAVVSSRQVLPHIRSPFVRPVTCEWVVSVRSRRTIQVSFDSFNVPSDSVCSSNYLMLRNGEHNESPLLGDGKFCGSTTPTLPETSTNKVYVKLMLRSISQGSPQFDLRFRELSLGCGGRHFLRDRESHLVVTSPNYPSPPSHPLECVWVVMSPAGTRMRIDFDEEFHMSRNCYFGERVEFLETRDGGTEEAPPLHRYCGHEQPSSKMTTGNALYMLYSTSVEHPEAGFRATIRMAECGGFQMGYNNVIQSPHYPEHYGSGLECEWTLKMRIGAHLSLKLLDLDTPPSANCSLTDYLEVRNQDSQGDVLGIYCGQLENGTLDISVPGAQAYVKFKSNSAVTGKGFKMVMQMTPDSCKDGTTLSTFGDLTSPHYPQALPGMRSCTWRIHAPEGRRVTVTFNSFNLPRDEASGHCLSFIMFHNTSYFGYPRSSGRMICGNALPETVESSSSELQIQFHTAGLAAGQGFSLTYNTENEALCGGALQLPSGLFETPNFEPQDSWVECKWKTTPSMENQTLTFKFDVLDLPGKLFNYCRGGGLSITRDARAGSYYGYICGNLTNQNMMVSSSAPFTSLRMATSIKEPFGGIRGSYNVSECGGTLDGSNAVIMSPGYPNNYPPNTNCLWLIFVPPGEVIKLTTVDMRLEENCDKDFVEIRNGWRRDSPIEGHFCGSILPVTLSSDRNTLSVLFRSDALGTAPGFKMTTTDAQTGCSGVIHKRRGTITTPNYGEQQPYAKNLECVWTIEYPKGFLVNLTFIGRFDIERSNDCTKDYILIEEFDDVAWTASRPICGHETPAPVLSKGRTVRVTFRSDSDVGGDGFQIGYQANCGGRYTDISGQLTSPNFPLGYEDNLKCEYVVGQPGHYVQIEFDPDHFGIENHPSCKYDWVELFEGNTTSAPGLGRFCGDQAPDSRTVMGPVLIYFETDSIYGAKGFLVNYEIIACGAVLTEPSGIISSTPSKAEQHWSNMDCKWQIHGQPNKVIALKFNFFSVQPNSHCYSDYLQVREGNETGAVIATLCGEGVKNIIKSTGNDMFLHFHTDEWYNMKGFSAGYYSTFGPLQGCGGTITAPLGEFSSLDTNSDGLYESDLDCTWYIIGLSADQVLKLEFAEFDLEEADNNTCRYDYVEVRENMGPRDLLVGRFCGHNKPDPIVSSGNKVSVHFHSDDKIQKPGFKLKFSYLPSPCGASALVATGTAQTLKSPNYPNAYPANLRCRWNLFHNASDARRVLIKIANLDIPCNGDYLEVMAQQDHYYGQPPHISRLCGPAYPHEIVAESGVTLTLHSDAVADGGKGLLLTYALDECNRTYVGASGRILSPGYPLMAPIGNCAITIVAPPGHTIALYFDTHVVSRERDPNCDHAGLRIYDGFNASAPIMTTMCTAMYYYQTLVSSGHLLHIQMMFNPPAEVNFAFTYTTTDQGRGCGGPLNAQERGLLTSPSYPTPYNQSSECSWIISVPGYHSVHMWFAIFDLTSQDGCDFNYLDIYEGPAAVPEQRVTHLCGSDFPSTFISQGSQVLVKLVTNPSNRGSGFVMYFAAGELTAESSENVVLHAPSSSDSSALQGGTYYLNNG